jgi:hypothetical protein
MLEIRKAVVPLNEADVMALERIVTDGDEKEALRFLQKTVYEQILRSQQGRLKSHIDSAGSVEGFIQSNQYLEQTRKEGGSSK